MVEKAKIFYFGVFILVVFAFIFHVTAMGYNHWKKADPRNTTIGNSFGFNHTTIGLFTRCVTSTDQKIETCFPNLFFKNASCSIQSACLQRVSDPSCPCDFLPSTKGIAACAIIAAIFLGLAIIILFIHSINTSETRSLGLFLGLFPLILLLLALIFILITLILVGSYLSRDIMELVRDYPSTSLDTGVLRDRARQYYKVRVDWSTGLEIISIFFTFVSLILYMDRLNIKAGKSPATHSSVLLDHKYDDIRLEVIHAGILLKETDEKVEEIINDGHLVKSHAHDVRSNALRFYENLIQSEKIIRYCQWIFIMIIITIAIIFIGKIFISKKSS